MYKPSASIFRTKVLKGVAIPAIIHNDSYFFTDIGVYEDGRVDCWNFEDFSSFKKDVKRGWVVLKVPDNESLSVHGLGVFTVENGTWLFHQSSFIDHVKGLIKQLNPEMINIYEYRVKKVNGITMGERANGNIYKEHKKHSNDMWPTRVEGDGCNMFYKLNDQYYLVKINVYEDGLLQISRLEKPVELGKEELEKLVACGELLTDVPAGSVVNIYGLGSFSIGTFRYSVDVKDKLLEIQDLWKQMMGKPTSSHLCREAYQLYLNNPTAANKDVLKFAYEVVPTHQRRYLGDMDTKDYSIRKIIYGEPEVE